MKLARASLLLLLLAGALRASAVEKFTANHLARLRTVTAAEISPDGHEIAYLLSVPRRPFVDESGPAWTELHVVDLHGTSRPYVTGDVALSAIAWRPGVDLKGISFLAKREGDEHRAVYLIPVDGGEARKILEHDADIADYSWSPDGKQIAFTAADKQPEEKKKLADKGFNQQIYEEQLEMHRVWIGQPRQADAWEDEAAAKPQRFEIEGHASGVTWSPAGKHLAVAVAPTPLIDDDYMKKKIHILKAEDGTRVGVIETPGKLGPFRWSLDGEHLALLAGADIHDPNPGRLMVAPASGGKPLDILPDFTDKDVTGFAWTDENSLMFLADQGVTSAVGSVHHTGEHLTMIVPFGSYSLGALSISRFGEQVAILLDSPQHPQEVYLFETDTVDKERQRPRRLTNNNPWLLDNTTPFEEQEEMLAPQRIVRFKARDGLALEGLLIRPLDEQPGRRYPLVLVVHGGPEAHYRHGWLTAYSQPGQLLASEGFAVFYPNYRGSTGRGVEFSKRGQSDYAGGEFDDLVDGVDHLVKTGLVDKDKVGVTGGSYGGFASAWLATRYTDRFAASVMFVGISDLVSKFGTTDIPNEMYLVHARKMPWDDWDFFRQRSPITYAEQARTPLLIMHGKDDPRVHPSQSMELYRYLKTLGRVPVRLVLYPGEGHGNRKAAARQDYTLRLVRWMKHYLQGPGGEPPAPELDYSAVKPKSAEDDEQDAAGEGAASPAAVSE